MSNDKGLSGAQKDADKNLSGKPARSVKQPCLISLTVKFIPDQSDLPEVWDLWIEERPSKSVARFKILTNPENYNPISYSAQVEGPKGVVRKNLAAYPDSGPPTRTCLVRWDGTDDGGGYVPIGSYKIRLTAKAEGKESSDASADMKIIRVGVVYIRFKNVYPLKFAFKNYPAKYDTDDYDIPAAEWKLSTLDDGSKPRVPPICSTSGRSKDATTYCYPFAAQRNRKLKFRVGTAGENYAGGDKILLKIIKSGTEENWSDDEANGIGINEEHWFEANDGNKLYHRVSKMTDLRFDFLFEYTNSKGKAVQLGRQRCSKMVVYIIVSMPTEPWGLGTAPNRQRPWVELLEKICSDWAKGAQTVEEAASMIVEAVNHKKLDGTESLKYDTSTGADLNSLVTKTGPFKPVSIRLRAFFTWLAGDPGRPANWNVVNCTCCGALLSTIANCVGCSVQSSVLAKNDAFSPGFDCHKIISIGDSTWHHPFYNPADTSGGFSYHEVAWTGGAGLSDNIYDACLQVATDPVTSPGTGALYVKGMTFATSRPTIDDYRRRLVVPGDVASVTPRTTMAGRYRAD